MIDEHERNWVGNRNGVNPTSSLMCTNGMFHYTGVSFERKAEGLVHMRRNAQTRQVLRVQFALRDDLDGNFFFARA
jgi:hypothetical protein